MDEPETRLVMRAKEGDRQACSQLFAENWSIVYAWMLGFTRDRWEAEDLTQQAFARAFTRLPTLRDATRFLPWLRRVARTVALNRRHRSEASLSRLRPEETGPAADDQAVEREDRDSVRQALDRLSRKDRSLLSLAYLEDLPLARISALLEIPVTTLRRRIARALSRLRRQIERTKGAHHEL